MFGEGDMIKEEDIIVKKVTERLKQKLNRNPALKRFSVDHHVNILKDVTILPKEYLDENRFALVFGDTEADIVVYWKDQKIKIPFDGKVICRAKGSFPKSSSGNQNEHTIIPFIIFEFKKGRVRTHELITYSHKASEIKNIYPDVTYCMVLLDPKGLTITTNSRHSKFFDWIIRRWTDDIGTISNDLYKYIVHISKYRSPIWFKRGLYKTRKNKYNKEMKRRFTELIKR